MSNYPAFEAIQKAARAISQGIAETGSDTWETETISSFLQGLLDDLETAKDRIEYLSRPSQEGTLQRNDRGRYVVVYTTGDEISELTCGSPLEAFYDYEWHIGRVEHNGTDYYFTGAGQPMMATLEKVRRREANEL